MTRRRPFICPGSVTTSCDTRCHCCPQVHPLFLLHHECIHEHPWSMHTCKDKPCVNICMYAETQCGNTVHTRTHTRTCTYCFPLSGWVTETDWSWLVLSGGVAINQPDLFVGPTHLLQCVPHAHTCTCFFYKHTFRHTCVHQSACLDSDAGVAQGCSNKMQYPIIPQLSTS